jgi:LacI family transcriptional regulator
MSKVSIKHIADKLGVSNTTVSLVLSGKAVNGRVSKSMIEKIQAYAKELDYEPNNMARGLRVGKSKIIGLVVADISNLFFSKLAFYIQEHAEKFGYTVMITNTNESDEKLQKVINVLKIQQVDGYIIVPTENGEPYIRELVDKAVPVVLLDRYFPGLETSHVVVDNYNASKKAVKHLIKSGCKKIALVVYKSNLIHVLERKRGYIEALQEAGLYDKKQIKEIRYQNLDADMDKVVDCVCKEQVDGIFFATNSLSLKGIKRIIDKKFIVQEDIKVMCFDKNDAFDFTNIKIPYVLQPIPEMGEMAVSVLIELIEKNKNTPFKTELSSSIFLY